MNVQKPANVMQFLSVQQAKDKLAGQWK